MRRTLITALIAAAVVAPALAQSPQDVRRWQDAQARYRQQTDQFNAERDRFAAVSQRGRRYGGGYDAPPPRGYASDDRYDANYDASRYYRDGGQYQERVLASDDRVYAGQDGRYYCKRSDGTTGLIVGAAGGGVLGNVIDGGHSRTAGTLIGAAIGALAGKAVEQNQQNQQVRCR